MYDGGKIIIGIIIFVLIFTSPIWTNILSSGGAKKVNLKTPEDHTECVMDKIYMKANHMDLLNQWRDMVVRQNIRYVTKFGKQFMIGNEKAEMSLTKTCMNCHNDRANFCDQCHNYMDVDPYCWNCHVDKYEAETDQKPDNKIYPSIEASNAQALNNVKPNGEALK